MGISVNHVILAGNLTKDPEKRYTANNTCVVSLSLAVNRRVKKGDAWADEVSFFDVVVFGNRAENCAKFLSKGRPVLVDGILQQRRWETGEGQKRSKVEVVANDVHFLGQKSEGGEARTETEGGQEAPPEELPFEEEDSGIPF